MIIKPNQREKTLKKKNITTISNNMKITMHEQYQENQYLISRICLMYFVKFQLRTTENQHINIIILFDQLLFAHRQIMLFKEMYRGSKH